MTEGETAAAVRPLNTTTAAQVSEVHRTVDALRLGLNEYDTDLTVEQRIRTAGASEALGVAEHALALAIWNLTRVEKLS